jgi:hypothetical protein
LLRLHRNLLLLAFALVLNPLMLSPFWGDISLVRVQAKTYLGC